MFDGGVPDQFRQFISSRSSIPLPLSFPHHGVAVVSSPAAAPPPPGAAFPGCFESYPQTLFPPPPPHHHHHHHQQGSLQQLPQSSTNKVEEEKEEASTRLSSTNLVLERERSVSDHSIQPWTNDEVLALLRIRSSLENWFPDFTWEHVSRKLAEGGFQRSAEKCKEKFDEESRHFSNMSYNKNNYRFLSDLEELYHGENPQVSAEKTPNLENENEKEAEEEMDHNMGEDAGYEAVAKPSQENEELEKVPIKSRKRKRKHNFEMFKGFCEAIVKKIVAQQEELHYKLIEDLIRRDEESIAREEAWKNQEIDRINKEIEKRAQEQAIAGDRQAKIIEFLKKFTADFSQDQNLVKKIQDLLKVTNGSNSATASCEILTQSINTTRLLSEQISNPTFLQTQNLPTSSSETTPSPHNRTSAPTINVPKATSSSMASQNPNDSTTKVQENIPVVSTPSSAPKFPLQMDEKGGRDIGKRWRRDEVLALINLRSSFNNNNNDDNKDASKGPLWERISRMMLELGYKRSAKRCKEKWENINKYFRKTKDSKKKRSMDSRTCPYFHQLSRLYSQGTLVGPSDAPENP